MPSKNLCKVAWKSSVGDRKSEVWETGVGLGNKGQEWGLGTWQFVCKQVTSSWHSSADSRALGKCFQRIESFSSGDSWGGEETPP